MANEVKRILSFDGGGIRGIFSLQIAARIEQIFRDQYGQPDLVLSDVIDLFAGTSTGAIIATFLAWGLPVADVESLYVTHAKQMFARQPLWRRIKSKYRAEAIADFFKANLREDDQTVATLGSSKLKKLLLLVVRNATTGSPWPICSNPHAIYNDRTLTDCNLDIPLWQLLRASTAAPLYFPPEEIKIGGENYLFVDGGVSPYNNPALLAVLVATLPCYRLNWPAGRDALHVVSIGTGAQRTHLTKLMANQINIKDELAFTIPGLMGAFASNQDMLCRVLGECLHGCHLDTELGCLDSATLLKPGEQKFSYARYNCMMDSAEVGVPMMPDELQLDNLRAIERLQQIGRDYAQKTVKYEHLDPVRRPVAFNPPLSLSAEAR